MRFSPLVILSSSLILTTVAAPIQQASQNDVDTFLKDFSDSLTSQLSASISGAVDAVKQFLANPALAVARIQVVQGLNETADAVAKVSADANSTDNAGVQNLVTQAQGGIDQIVAAVGRIGQAISTGTTPNKNDQKLVAEGINTTATAINSMEGAVKNQDDNLSSDIQAAVSGITDLINGAKAVLAASNISLADLGISDSGNDSSADSAGDDSESGSDTASNGGNGNDVGAMGGVSDDTDGASVGNGNDASAVDGGEDAGVSAGADGASVGGGDDTQASDGSASDTA